MTIEQRLENELRKSFHHWDEISAFDPTKIMAEAVRKSLISLHQSAVSQTESVLDSIPSILGVLPRPARAAQVLCLAQMREGSQHETIDPGFHLHTRQGDQHFILENESFTSFLHPEGIDFSKDPQSSRLTLKVNCPNQKFSYKFLIKNTDGSLEDSLGLAQIKLWNLECGTEMDLKAVSPQVHLSNYSQTRQTEILTLAGDFGIFSGPCQLEINLYLPQYPQDCLGNIQVVPNLAIFSIAEQITHVDLGTLEGVFWEKVSLPERMLSIPAKLDLAYANDRKIEIERCDDDFLKIKSTDPERYKYSFLFQGEDHSIIIPKSNELNRGFHSKSRLQVKSALMMPPTEDIEKLLDQEIHPQAEDHHVKSYQYLQTLSQPRPRETKQAFLARFYGQMRDLQQNKSKSLLQVTPGWIENKILESFTAVEKVKIVSQSQKQFTVCVVHRSTPLALDQSLIVKIDGLLQQNLPLGTHWTIVPFEYRPIEISIQVEFSQRTQRLGTSLELNLKNLITESIEEAIEDLNGSILQSKSSLSKTLLRSVVLSTLTKDRDQHSELKHHEVNQIEILIFDKKKRSYVDVVALKPSELVEANLKTAVRHKLSDISTQYQNTSQMMSGGIYAS